MPCEKGFSVATVPKGQGKVRLRGENRNTNLRRLHLVLGASQDRAASTGASNKETDDSLRVRGDQRWRKKRWQQGK